MSVELLAIRDDRGAFVPANDHDQEEAKRLKAGRPYKLTATQWSERTAGYHRRYWQLVTLTLEYWEPAGGLITSAEKKTLSGFIDFLAEHSGGRDAATAIANAAQIYLGRVESARSRRVAAPEKSKKALHEEIKLKAGWVEHQPTSNGLRVVTKSINFNAMDELEFREFYKDAFRVCWQMVLVNVFTSQKDAALALELEQEAMNWLLEFS